jgi:hypothetical protein
MSQPHEVREPSKIVFLVMDGRARYDVDEAECIEVIDEYVNYERVWKAFVKDYSGYDYCLVPFLADGNTLTHPKEMGIIDSQEDLANL